MANNSLTKAKKAKVDEFYTQLADIEVELKHYREHFKGKTVLCNCDDPRMSNFFYYFVLNFHLLGLKKLITTCYKNQNPDLFSESSSEQAVYLVYKGEDIGTPPDPTTAGLVYPLQGDGDFRSKECIAFLEEADIVVTNPPFSLFREYIALLIEYKKQFVIVGNTNAVTYTNCFDLIRDNKMWLGYNCLRWFYTPAGTLYEAARSYWYTNLDIQKRHAKLTLYKKYSPEEYPRYDNYDAINVDKTTDIPCDYDGVMGVPITYLDKHNPDQFEIIGATESEGKGFSSGLWDASSKVSQPMVNGKRVYKRIFIRKRKQSSYL
jgi:modification methylase ecoRI